MMKIIYNSILKKREYWRNWERKRDLELVIPESVLVRENVRIGQGAFHIVDVYCPKQNRGSLPVIVNIHGGGFLMGTKHQNLGQCISFAQEGFLVFAVEYPLVPEATVYEQLRSVAGTLSQIGKVLEQYQGDSQRVFLTGDSAGAFLAFYTVVLQNNKRLADLVGGMDCALPIKALGLSSGLFYSTRVEKNGIFLFRKSFFGRGWRRQEFTKYLNPEQEEVLEGLTACCLSTSKGDFLKHHTIQLAKALERKGVEYRLIYMEEDVEHAFNALYPQWQESVYVNKKLVEFFLEQ